MGENTTWDAILEPVGAVFSWPVVLVYIYVELVMVTGLLGNLLVVVVYVTKFKATTTRSFIIALAVIDLVKCSIGMPLDLLTLSSDFGPPTGILCKMFGGTFMVTYFLSALLLVVVASDRFRKVCRPLATQLSERGAHRAIAGCGLITAVIARPYFVFAGQRQVTIDAVNVTLCDIENRFDDSTYPLIYFNGLFVVFLGACDVLLVLYSWIIIQIRNAPTTSESPGPSLPVAMFLPVRLPASSVTTDRSSHGASSESTLTALTDNSCSTDQTTDNSDVSGMSSRNDASDVKEPASSVSRDNTSDDSNRGVEDKYSRSTTNAGHIINDTRRRKRDAAVRRTTITMFQITLLFVVSFFPYFFVMTLVGLKVIDSTGLWSFVVIDLCARFPYIQSAANPLIYGARHREFRDKCKRLLDGLKCNATLFPCRSKDYSLVAVSEL